MDGTVGDLESESAGSVDRQHPEVGGADEPAIDRRTHHQRRGRGSYGAPGDLGTPAEDAVQDETDHERRVGVRAAARRGVSDVAASAFPTGCPYRAALRWWRPPPSA